MYVTIMHYQRKKTSLYLRWKNIMANRTYCFKWNSVGWLAGRWVWLGSLAGWLVSIQLVWLFDRLVPWRLDWFDSNNRHSVLCTQLTISISIKRRWKHWPPKPVELYKNFRHSISLQNTIFQWWRANQKIGIVSHHMIRQSQSRFKEWCRM
jgi:hypothetical protein